MGFFAFHIHDFSKMMEWENGTVGARVIPNNNNSLLIQVPTIK